MFNFIKNKFAFIITISVLTLGLLIAGAVIMYQDNTKTFENEGYIISTTAKKNSKYYFSPNTKYKENVDKDIVFKDSDSKSVTVSAENFVHYQNGSLSFLTKGAILNLGEINSSALNYYNVDNDDLITYKNKSYVVNSNKGTVNIDSFIGRISDNKYIIAGKDLALKIPNKTEKITGDYFEVLFIENGIVKIDNNEVSYQVTAQDTTISVGNDTVIDLGTGKIFHNGEAKMLMSQLTINGDENIDIETVDNKEEKSKGSGSGEGTDGNGEDNNGTTNDNSETNPETGEQGNETGENGNGGNGGNGKIDATAQIELIEANVTSTNLNASFQLNNASAIKGKLMATLTNVNSNKKELEREIDVRNGTFTLSKESLLPDSEYTLTITEITDKGEKQYFQKTFKTNNLGIILEKEYATSSSLAYSIKFDENSEVSKAKLVMYDSNGELVKYKEDGLLKDAAIIEASEISKVREFSDLISNSNYSVKVESIWIRNIEYSDVYTINRIDSTLKQAPILSQVSVTASPEEVKFTIRVKDIQDPDKGIVSFRYNIYKSDDITLDNPNPEPVYTVNKNDSDDLILNLGEIEELKTGVDYRCKVIALYDDNTMIRESASDYSANFLIKSKPNVTWTTISTSINKVAGTLKITDANCSIPLSGRSCNNKANNIVLRYYKLGNENNVKTTPATSFNSATLESDVPIELTELISDTTYVVKVYGNYIDDDNVEHSNVQIGDLFYVKTDASENLKFKVIEDNKSGVVDGNVVTFDAKLEAPKDSTISDEISSITFKLYSGSYNVENKLIGTYTMEETSTIKDFFNNFTITNKLFTNESVGLINTVEKLITLTNNQSETLNATYTVEVASVLDSAGVNEIYVEDNIYTFKLTPTYFLDVRVDRNSASKFITVTPIKKKALTPEELSELSHNDSDLEHLNDDTVVGLIIENTLSDTYVDSAFIYEKVVVDYVIFNNTTQKEVKRVSVDMGNKYQPKSQTVFLDPTELDDGETKFTRGYNYNIRYELKFKTEDGENPTYSNEKLGLSMDIKKQSAIFSQYISTSTANNITYRFKITDIDKSLFNNKLYYTYQGETEKNSSTEDLVIDGKFHDITLPISERKEYSIYFREKSLNANESYKEISKYTFEKEYEYDNQNAFQIVNDNDNTLKIKVLNNDITDRAAAYRITIKDNSGNLEDYSRFFLASKLITETVETGEVDENEEPITRTEKYIALDYAKINQFMKKDLTISVTSYYNSGLVGYNQQFPNGMILYKSSIVSNKPVISYLNIYNKVDRYGIEDLVEEENNEINGITKINGEFNTDAESVALYNYLKVKSKNVSDYDKLFGVSYFNTTNKAINFTLNYANAGVILVNGNKQYSGYNPKVIKTATLKSSGYSYRFDSITPKVSIESNNTINSLKLKVNSTGVYGQFTKGGQEHNIFYLDVYSNKDLTAESHIKTLTSNITITENNAESEEVELKNLNSDTTYYVTVSAYIDGVLKRLYDMDSKDGYVVKTYESKTFGANEILKKIIFSVNPTSYNNESSNKTLSWQLNLKNTENYKLRFELYDNEDRAVKFDGSIGASCNKNAVGTEANAYVNNCYILVSKEDVANIKNKKIDYVFTGDNFVFGGEYYKLKVYAIPYTNDAYKEDDKVTLYENESLTSTPNVDYNDRVSEYITIPTINSATMGIDVAGLRTGTRCITEKDSEGNTVYEGTSPVCLNPQPTTGPKVEYYIEFTPAITDVSYAIKYGTYTIKLKNSKNEIVSAKTNVSASAKNKIITFVGLDANELYYVELSYETYRNNVGFTDSQKIATTPFTDFIYTPIDAGITLGTITAMQNNNKRITLTYNGAYNIDHIKKIEYTISLKGGSSTASGSFEIAGDVTNIFTISSDKTPKLSIDLAESSDENFTLRSGNTYIINTQYWYKDGGNYILLQDQNTQKNTFTTILNL